MNKPILIHDEQNRRSKRVRNLSVLFFILLAIYTAAVSLAATAPPQDTTVYQYEGEYSVGYTEQEFTFINKDGEQETVFISVWYPTNDQNNEIYIYKNGLQSYVVEDADVLKTDGGLPLVLYSHGFNSDKLHALHLKEYLASCGYIVVAPDYNDHVDIRFASFVWDYVWQNINILDSKYEGQTISDRVSSVVACGYEAFLDEYRVYQAKATLDYMLTKNNTVSSLFYGAICKDNIAAIGHSMGGATTLALTGEHSDPSVYDSRIKAAILLSSPIYPYQNNDLYTQVPVMVLNGSMDLMASMSEAERWCSPYDFENEHIYAIVPFTHHFDFGNVIYESQGSVGYGMLYDERIIAIDSVSHAFFEYFLMGNEDAYSALLDPSYWNLNGMESNIEGFGQIDLEDLPVEE